MARRTAATRTVETVTSEAALAMANFVADNFRKYFRRGETQKGVFVVLGMLRQEQPLVLTTHGAFTEGNMDIVMGKVHTSAATLRDTKVQAQLIEKEDLNVGDYNGAVRTTFGGGVVLYADRACTIVVGFAAFSGIPRADGDIKLVRDAAKSVGLFTQDYDIPDAETNERRGRKAA